MIRTPHSWQSGLERGTPPPRSSSVGDRSCGASAAAHLNHDIDEVAGDPSTVIDELWRPIATEQRERGNRGAPLTHRLVELKATSRRSERLLGPLQALLVDG